jgi:hypothetical protein
MRNSIIEDLGIEKMGNKRRLILLYGVKHGTTSVNSIALNITGVR